MKRLSATTRRVIAVAAAVVAGLAISSAAYAATSSGTARAAASSVPRCTASGLGAWIAVGQGNGAAGTIYYPLEFTNLSGHTCSLYGFPGVSAVGRAENALAGIAAGPDTGRERVVFRTLLQRRDRTDGVREQRDLSWEHITEQT